MNNLTQLKQYKTKAKDIHKYLHDSIKILESEFSELKQKIKSNCSFLQNNISELSYQSYDLIIKDYLSLVFPRWKKNPDINENDKDIDDTSIYFINLKLRINILLEYLENSNKNFEAKYFFLFTLFDFASGKIRHVAKQNLIQFLIYHKFLTTNDNIKQDYVNLLDNNIIVDNLENINSYISKINETIFAFQEHYQNFCNKYDMIAEDLKKVNMKINNVIMTLNLSNIWEETISYEILIDKKEQLYIIVKEQENLLSENSNYDSFLVTYKNYKTIEKDLLDKKSELAILEDKMETFIFQLESQKNIYAESLIKLESSNPYKLNLLDRNTKIQKLDPSSWVTQHNLDLQENLNFIQANLDTLNHNNSMRQNKIKDIQKNILIKQQHIENLLLEESLYSDYQQQRNKILIQEYQAKINNWKQEILEFDKLTLQSVSKKNFMLVKQNTLLLEHNMMTTKLKKKKLNTIEKLLETDILMQTRKNDFQELKIKTSNLKKEIAISEITWKGYQKQKLILDSQIQDYQKKLDTINLTLDSELFKKKYHLDKIREHLLLFDKLQIDKQCKEDELDKEKANNLDSYLAKYDSYKTNLIAEPIEIKKVNSEDEIINLFFTDCRNILPILANMRFTYLELQTYQNSLPNLNLEYPDLKKIWHRKQETDTKFLRNYHLWVEEEKTSNKQKIATLGNKFIENNTFLITKLNIKIRDITSLKILEAKLDLVNKNINFIYNYILHNH